MKPFLFLFAAIVCEVIGTSFLKKADQFTQLVPSIVTVLAYIGAFYCLSVTLKDIPVGIAYAIWAGVGIVLVALVGLFYFKQSLDWASVIGMALIILGVVIINVFSKAVSH